MNSLHNEGFRRFRLIFKAHPPTRKRDIVQNPGGMMETLAGVAPLLADPGQNALPGGVMASLLGGCGRKQGSLLLFKPNSDRMD